MKQLYQLTTIFLLSFILFISSCKKDPDEGMVPYSSTVSTTVAGRVTIGGYIPVSGVTVKIGTFTTTTNAQGLYVFNNVLVPSDYITVIFEKTPYVNQAVNKSTQKGGINYVDVLMYPDFFNVDVVSASAGGNVSFPGPNPNGLGNIYIPPNVFEDMNGNLYSGPVRISVFVLDIENQNWENMTPGGEIRAITPAGLISTFYPSGIVRVAAYNDNTEEPLQIGEGKIIQVCYPVSFNHSYPGGVFNYWRFNSSTGLWDSKGLPDDINLCGETNIEIDETGTWAIGSFLPIAVVHGKVVNCLNQPMPGVTVAINNHFTTRTDNQGNYTVRVPAITEKILLFVDGFNNSFITSGSGYVSQYIHEGINNFSDIVVPCTSILSGNITNCTGTTVAAGFVTSAWSGNTFYTYSTNGSYYLHAPASTPLIVAANFHAFSGQVNTTSGVEGSIKNVPNVAMCAPNDQPARISFSFYENYMSTDYVLTPTNTTATRVDTTGDGTYDKMTISIQGNLYPGNENCTMLINLAEETSPGNYHFGNTAATKNNISITIGSSTYVNYPVVFINISFTDHSASITDMGSTGLNLTGTFDFDADNPNYVFPGFKNGKFYALRVN